MVNLISPERLLKLLRLDGLVLAGADPRLDLVVMASALEALHDGLEARQTLQNSTLDRAGLAACRAGGLRCVALAFGRAAHVAGGRLIPSRSLVDSWGGFPGGHRYGSR